MYLYLHILMVCMDACMHACGHVCEGGSKFLCWDLPYTCWTLGILMPPLRDSCKLYSSVKNSHLLPSKSRACLRKSNLPAINWISSVYLNSGPAITTSRVHGKPCPSSTSQTFEDGNCQSQKPSKRRQSWRKAKVSPQRVERNNRSLGEFHVIKFHHIPATSGYFGKDFPMIYYIFTIPLEVTKTSQ